MLETEKFLNYKIIKSNKFKRLTITIQRSQHIVVSAPNRVSDKKITEFIEKNEQWINKNLERLEMETATKSHTYLEGDVFLLYRETYKLAFNIIDDELYNTLEGIVENIIIEREKKLIIIPLYNKNLCQDSLRDIVLEFYKQETQRIIDTLFEEKPFLKQLKHNIAKIKIQKSNSRWGSCSKNNNINFSFRIAMLPLECIEYVILHEITHITEKNHQITFYKKLEELCPNYLKYEREIKRIERSYNISLA